MKAVVYTEYGSPNALKLEEIEKATPKDNEVLVKIHAASLNTADWYSLRGDPFLIRLSSGLFRPKNKILGFDIAGRVEAVGKSAKQFKPGDEVFGDISGCGGGGFAEYVAVPESALALKPVNLTFEEAAAVPMAGVTALQGIRDYGQLKPGQKVLINGASGGVGTFAVQIAKSFGAEVTAVCSTAKMDMARSIGADHVMDYTKEDFTQNGKRYDLILGVNGHQSLSGYKRALNPGGRYICVGGTMAQIFEAMLFGPLLSMNGNKTLKGMEPAQPNQTDLEAMKRLIEAGTVVPVIEKRYPLTEVPEALRHLGRGRATGKIIITIHTGE
ncbi:MAG: NAD(P)-dependent alcohol dehydrogenase [Chloroflexota bacterium]